MAHADGWYSDSGAYHLNSCRCPSCLARPPLEPPVREHPTLLEVAEHEGEIFKWEIGQRKGPRPRPLGIVKFNSIENDYLIYHQPEEPFRANCTCPGCGKVDVHLLTNHPNAPKWATVVRHCQVCDREWAQA